jgi:MYXO-CTERM domain-containing protein
MLRPFILGALVVGIVTTSPPAHACGGCFAPKQTVTVVNAHRMVLSVSQAQTVLWDQFNYSGNPSDFAWVLPVHAASTQVELAHDEFISALDAWTAPVISGPVQSGGGGCGSNSAAFNAGGANGVQVINQQVVGPYDVATLQSTDPNALMSWLSQSGYDVQPSLQPVIAAYVADSFDFIALRLQPGQGIAAMQPVRVVSAGADPTLPLRMVAAGVGTDVSILLYVISEGRYEAANFNNTEVDFSQLSWNKSTNTSNYATLVQNAMTSGDGRNFTVEFAGPMFSNESSFLQPSFTTVYGQAVTSSNGCTYQEVEGADFDGGLGLGFSVDAGSSDAATVPASDGGLAQPYNACSFDDLTVATAGLNHADVFVTRLRADLTPAALSQDLVLQASATQSAYSNQHTATTGDGCEVEGTAPARGLAGFAVAGLAAILLLRRKRAA